MRFALVAAAVVALVSGASHAQGEVAATPNDDGPPETLSNDPAANAPPPPSTPTTPATTPATTPSTTPATTPSTTPSMTLGPQGARFDQKAEDAYQECQRTFATDVEEARECYRRVVALHAGTEAALKAEAALFVLDARLAPPAESPALIPAGRLGITTATGLFGAWNAAAVGLMVANSNASSLSGGTIVLVTGIAAVVVGVGAGAGGYYLADTLQLDEGAARLVASSLVWGTVMGAAAAPSIQTALSSQSATFNPVPFNVAIGTVVAAGYVVGGAALLLAANVPFDEAQVGMINSGGLIGVTTGALIALDLSVSSTDNPNGRGYLMSSVVVLSTAVGLGTGGVLGRVLDMTWGEVLLCDLGGVLGVIGGGAVGVGLAGNVSPNSSTGALYFGTGAAIVGLVGGYLAAGAIVETWRDSRGAPLLRGGPDVAPVALALVDAHGRSVTGVGVAGTF